MDNHTLWKTLESVARDAKRSGKAKSRLSHSTIGKMLFLILAAWALDMENEMYEGMKKLSDEIRVSWEDRFNQVDKTVLH